MNSSITRYPEIIHSLDVLFSAPSFTTCYSILSYGYEINILYDPSGRQSFFHFGSDEAMKKYLEISCRYILTISPDYIISEYTEGLSLSECRIYIKHMVINNINRADFMPIDGGDILTKRILS